MGLSRGVQNGLLTTQRQGSEVYYLISDKAAMGVKYWQETLAGFNARVPLQLSDWDCQWSILYIKSYSDKQSFGEFTDLIRKYSYGRLGSVWVSPYNFTGEIEALAKKSGVKSFFQFRGKLEGNRSPEEVAHSVWPIKDLVRKYSDFIKTVNEAAGKLDMDSYNGGGGLPFLHIHGQQFFELIQDDPQLPMEILPRDWPGLQAAKLFLDLRGRILPKAGSYISHRLSG